MVLGEVEMPDAFFDDEGELPHSAELRFVRPGIFRALSDVEVQGMLRDAIAKRVKRARDDMALRGLPFLGRDAVVRQSFSAVPKRSEPRRNPSPRIAAKSTPARVGAIRKMLGFVRQYRAAWCSWREGNRAVVSLPAPMRCGFTLESRARKRSPRSALALASAGSTRDLHDQSR